MASEQQMSELKEMIDSFFKLAQQPAWNGEINEGVAEVFGIMLFDTQKCSAAFKWLPPPPGGRATISWLLMKLANGVFRSHSKRLSMSCARVAIAKWRTPLELASQGIAMGRLPKCCA